MSSERMTVLDVPSVIFASGVRLFIYMAVRRFVRLENVQLRLLCEKSTLAA